jgi:hypothetical protein
MTLPMCWGSAKLEQLQHTAIKEGALMQQVSVLELSESVSVSGGLVGNNSPLFPYFCTQSLRCDLANVNGESSCFVPALDFGQERLKGLFPDLMETEGLGDCSWFAWAFACVRSRAFKCVLSAGEPCSKCRCGLPLELLGVVG